MAEIVPFRGLRYNGEKVPDLAKVVIPPYDVISAKEQELFYKTSLFNAIRLELGKSTPEDTARNSPHTRAAAYLQEWQRDEILIRDDQPAIYYYEHDYSLSPQLRQTRNGFICILRLEDFGSGSVRPHEKTFQAVKDERLQLMLACQANLSPVFALYADPGRVIDHTLRTGREPDPAINFMDRQGMEHRIWRVKGLELLQQVRALMIDKPIFIADGHHRYETALNFRSIQRDRFPDASPRSSFEYIMIYLSNLNQEGLTILPTHRLLRRWNGWDSNSFLATARDYFEIASFEAGEAGKDEWRAALEAAGAGKESAIGFYWQGAHSFYLLRAKQEMISSYLAGQGVPEALRGLDVVILDQLLLKHLLALPETFLASENNIHFKHDFSEALFEVRSGNYEAGFFINPTRIEQVQEVASAGLIMPHKSTYFYPKVGSGLVIRPLVSGEEALW